MVDNRVAASVQLDRAPGTIREARHWVVDVLDRRYRLSRPGLDLAAVLTSELVTNVLRHTSSSPSVTVSEAETTVVVSVFDDDPGEPRVQAQDATRVGGNGLRLVAELAEDWGVEGVPGDGKAVWFAVPR